MPFENLIGQALSEKLTIDTPSDPDHVSDKLHGDDRVRPDRERSSADQTPRSRGNRRREADRPTGL